MTFGLTVEKLLLIGLIAVLLIGPSRLPGFAAGLARTVVRVRAFARGANERLRDEIGPEMSDVDWRQLDPRRYDPRRIIREALLDDVPPTPPLSTPATAPPPAPAEDGAASAGSGSVGAVDERRDAA